MGSVISTLMDSYNSNSVADHPILSVYRRYGVEAEWDAGTEKPGFSPILRFANTSAESMAKLADEYYHSCNWVQMIRDRCQETPHRPALGYRVLDKIEKREVTDAAGKTKVCEYYHCSPYKTISYEEMWRKIESFGRGLVHFGLKPGARVSIFEETRWEWMVTIYGIWTQDLMASTVYANLGEDALAYALCETMSEAIICNGKVIPTLLKLINQKGLSPLLIYLDDKPAHLDEGDYRIVSWTEVMAAGERMPDAPVKVPSDNDAIALIMYTSGTTGDPKGVMHSHGSLAAGIRALSHRLLDIYKPGEEGEIYVAYLPLAHILEFAIVNIILNRGSLVGFGTPRTLTDNFAVPHGDLHEFKPLVIIAVPRVFDTIRKTVEARLPKRGTLKRQIFDKAYASRRKALLQGQETPYWNDRVFSQARAVLGGAMYGMLSGGGPLSASTQEFVNVVCGGPLIIQGWGLTETVCCGATQRLGDIEPGCVGQLLMTAELRLKGTEEYKHTDKPEPRGEICLRGPFMFKGYYKQPELTKEVLDEEGWFRTGDVGSITKDGKLRIIGRVKALAKNVLGEYIALETLESIYTQNELCAVNGVCVLVHPEKTYVSALVLTQPHRAEAFAKDHGIEGSYPDILANPAFHNAAAASLAETAKAAGRKSFELVKHVRVLEEEWTAESGLLTPTMKPRRTQIEQHYKDLIESLFKD